MRQFSRRFIVFLLSFIACSSLTYAQLQGQALIDSLLKAIPSAKEDSNKAKLLNAVSLNYSTINPDEGVKYGEQALDMATKLGWKRGMSASHNALGLSYRSKADYQSELNHYTTALKIDEETGSKLDLARENLGIGNVYGSLCNFPKALEYYHKAIKLNEETGNKKSKATTFISTGNVYFVQSDFAKALDHYFSALKAYEDLSIVKGVATASFSIGNVYASLNDLSKSKEYYFKSLTVYQQLKNKQGIAMVMQGIGNIYAREKKYDSALEYDMSSLKLAEEIGIKYIATACTGNIGDVYLKKKNYLMAVFYGERASHMAEEIGDIHQLAWELGEIGHAYLDLVQDTVSKNLAPVNSVCSSIPTSRSARLKSAISFFERGLDSATKVNIPTVMQSCLDGLTRAYTISGDYKKALEYSNKFIKIKDSVYSNAHSEQIVKIGMEYAYNQERLATRIKAEEAKKAAALKLKRQRIYTWIGISGALLLAGILFLMNKNYKLLAKEKLKSEKLLLNILPAEVADELKTTGSTVAKHFDNVTVMFTDFVNFTQAGERMSPAALIDELHTCFKAFDEITAKYGIEKIKTIGDAYLAVAGLPVADRQHGEHVVRAAIDILAYMNERKKQVGDNTFDVRIGIHSGSAVAGIVGVTKFAYDIWGDTVNTAARMEQNSTPGKINISQTTYNLVKDKFVCTYRGEIVAKNKGELKMYFVG